MNEINSGTYVEPSKHQWIDHYARSNCGELTLQGYEYIINQHFIPSIGKVRIDDLKTMYIQKYYTDKLRNGRIDGKGGLSAQTVLHHHRLLHEILELQ
jgi:hypothetical protein